MALSPNYNWSEPDNSSLVKNGAADIRTLGDAIDTSVWNVGYGQAGKNKIINGDFRINQRNFTSITTTSTFTFDRWQAFVADGTSTISNESFSPAAAPVAGYEGKSYLRMASTGQTLTTARTSVFQYIEDCRVFAGQTVTVSFWAKAATGTPNVAIEFFRNYGTGGSPSASESVASAKLAITSSWVRYSTTLSIPSLSGKTLGTTDQGHLDLGLWTSAGTGFNARTSSLGIQTATIDWWGLQVEYGSKMTPFQTASGGSPEAELAMCQRYYWRVNANEAYSPYGAGAAQSTTKQNAIIYFPTIMRTKPSSVDFSALNVLNPGVAGFAVTALTQSEGNIKASFVSVTVAAGLVLGSFYALSADATSNGYLGFSAEL